MDFYNFKQQPFNLTPSPPFLYLGKVHREALSVLTYGVIEPKGFVLLTGDVGTGKSTMVQALLSRLDKTVEFVYLPNPVFSPEDLLSYLAFSAFKKRRRVESKAEFLIEFEAFLHKRMQHQKKFILIIDEAQKLSFDVLEEVRLLSNTGATDRNSVNIFLVGQPELNYKLSQPKYRPLLQRVSMRYHVWPLDMAGTLEYIAMAMKAAGGENGPKIFPKDVIKAIYQYSQGYPRMINILADNLLLLGYSRGQKRLTPSMVKECYDDMKLENTFPSDIRRKSEQRKTEEPRHFQIRYHWKWALALFCGIALLAVAMSQQGKHLIRRLSAIIPISHEATPDNVGEKQSLVKSKIVRKIQGDKPEEPQMKR